MRPNNDYVGIFRPSPLKCKQKHLTLCLLSFCDSLSRSFVETTMKANRMCPRKRHLSELAGKCINNCTRGRSRKRAELIVYYFRRRHLWGSKLHVGYSIHLRFLSRVKRYLGKMSKKKIVSGLIIMGIWQVGRLLRWGLGVVPAIIYHCYAVPVVWLFVHRILKACPFWLQPCG